MLNIENTTKLFHRGTPDERLALDDFSLTVADGDFAVIIGSNGAGKSTLLNLISGEIAADAGSVSIGGRDVTGLPPHRRSKWVARVFQDPMLGTAPSMTIEENLALAEKRGHGRGFRLALNPARRDAYRERLAALGLGLENRLGDKVELLSGGQRQSLSLIMAVMVKPAILLLDEHCAALDPRTAAMVMGATVKAIEAFKLTTLMVTHNMHQALEYGNRILMMEAGRLRLSLTADDKRGMTVEDLVERFHITDDKILLSA